MGSSGRKVRARSKKAKAELREAARLRREEELLNANGPLDQPSSDESGSDHSVSDQELPVESHHHQTFSAQKRAPRPGKEQAVSAKKAGTKNGDGTYYGGGPNTFSCSACLGAGLPADVAWGHRAGMRKHCVILQQQEAHGPEEESMPVQKIVSQILQEEPKNTESTALDNHSPDEVLAMLAQGAVTAQQAKLSWVQAMRYSTPAEREIL